MLHIKLAQVAVRCALPPRRSESSVCATDNKPSCVLHLLGWFIGSRGFSSLERRPEFWVLHTEDVPSLIPKNRASCSSPEDSRQWATPGWTPCQLWNPHRNPEIQGQTCLFCDPFASLSITISFFLNFGFTK